jgi:hypothetical protein
MAAVSGHIFTTQSVPVDFKLPEAACRGNSIYTVGLKRNQMSRY